MKTPLPVLALLFNALIWGLAWWPFRQMLDAGLHPLWATALMYAAIVAVLTLARPGIWAQARAVPALLLLAFSSGLNNVAFNWAISIGDVVRVILLFYLMPAWAVLLAWRILGERPTPAALGRLALAFAGVLLMVGNWALQYGAARLAAGTTAVVMLSEVVFASGSSMLAGSAQPTAQTLLGGTLVVGAALLAALRR